MTTRRERLVRRRKALGLTQEALAELLNVERSTVNRWERGETAPLPWIQPKLARALRVSAEQLAELLADTGAVSRRADRNVPPATVPGEPPAPGDNAPAASASPAAKPRRPPGLRSTRAAVAAAALAVAAIAAALTTLLSGSGPPYGANPAAHAASPSSRGASPAAGPVSAINWQCGPSRHAKMHHGSLINQILQACIASNHGHVEVEGTLVGSVDAWNERIILVLRHPGQPAYRRLISPTCTASTCVYRTTVAPDPGPGSWQVMPQWSSDGDYQSTGKSSPSIMYRPPP
jgi:transcriptional regulator with XRE-family HTH domain